MRKVFKVADTIVLQCSGGQYIDTDRHVLDTFISSRRSHDNLFNRVLLCKCTWRPNSAACDRNGQRFNHELWSADQFLAHVISP